MSDLTELGTILSIWAHPDDETYLAAGIMAAARDNGQRVVCATASAGERGSSDPTTWTPTRLGRIRRWEAAAAMAVLGVHEHEVYSLPDGELSSHEPAGRAWAGRLIEDVRPDTILTFGPDGMTYHLDHIAVHRWVTRAWRETGCRARLLYATPTVDKLARFLPLYEEWNMYMSDERPDGVAHEHLSLHLELQAERLDRKITALRVMASQTAAVMDAVDDQLFREMVAEESFVAAEVSAAPPRRAVAG
ncbi:PIG-L deacetylase family protein [Nocardia mangyaensis]|uniref:PIG-L deacetylase family protein n=1 Tax=Nocardia mangyaensis TaxID=2213200 RepID=UPI0026753939|nr:PIG-L deacetylase family protein [Nocardia mangyaensis]MDO3646314.1 PIG-L deacetylase family protein [Nocardia mangyaensis]